MESDEAKRGAPPATKRSEEHPPATKRSEERHMHWKLRYRTLLMVPQVGAQDRMVP